MADECLHKKLYEGDCVRGWMDCMYARSLPSCRRAAVSSSSAAFTTSHASRTTPRRHASSRSVTVNGHPQLKPTLYGQPLACSHAHLIRREETTPEIPQEEYHRRRRELMESLPEGSLVVCVAGQMKYMSGRKSTHHVSALETA